MNTYQIVLAAHSGFRWLALVLAIIVVFKSIVGFASKSNYGKLDKILGGSFIGTMHLQLLLGFVLYLFLSPNVPAFSDFGSAMSDPNLRFWAVEHLTIMLLAVVAAQIGRTKSKKATTDLSRFKFQLIFFSVSLILMLVGIPWDRVIG